MEQETQTPHKRRVRYKGKYPRKFEEKYKELNPEKYKDTIEHVISKGNTPAGMHISIMVNEILDFLQICVDIFICIVLFVCVVSVFPVPFYFSLLMKFSTIFNAVSLIKPPQPCPAFFSLTNSTSLSICFNASYKMQD